MFPKTSQSAYLYSLSGEKLLTLLDDFFTTSYQKRIARKILAARRGEVDGRIIHPPPSKAQLRARLLGQVHFHTKGMVGTLTNFTSSVEDLYGTDADLELTTKLLQALKAAKACLELASIRGRQITQVAIEARLQRKEENHGEIP